MKRDREEKLAQKGKKANQVLAVAVIAMKAFWAGLKVRRSGWEDLARVALSLWRFNFSFSSSFSPSHPALRIRDTFVLSYAKSERAGERVSLNWSLAKFYERRFVDLEPCFGTWTRLNGRSVQPSLTSRQRHAHTHTKREERMINR